MVCKFYLNKVVLKKNPLPPKKFHLTSMNLNSSSENGAATYLTIVKNM